MADYQIAAQLVIVITPYGTSEVSEALKLQQTIANIMGNSVTGTGLYAFLAAPNTLYCTPRIIIAPGYTGQMANSLDTLTVGTVGVGYIPGNTYQVTFATGEGEQNIATLVLPTAQAIAAPDGTIDDAEIFIDTWGAWFSVAPTATLPSPDGTVLPALPAVGQIMFEAQPGIGSSITFNSQPVTFIANGGSPGTHQVALGLNLLQTINVSRLYGDRM